MDLVKEPCLRCQRPWAGRLIYVFTCDPAGDFERYMGTEKIEVELCPLNEEEAAAIQKTGSCAARSPVENLTLRYPIKEIRDAGTK